MNRWQKIMDEAFKQMEEIRKRAERENRALTPEDLSKRAELKATIEAADRELKDFEGEEELRKHLYGDPNAGSGRMVDPGQPGEGYRMTGPGSDHRAAVGIRKGRTYRDLFGRDLDNGGFKDSREFFAVAQSGKYDPRLITRALTIESPSSGGFLVPGDTSAQIHDVALESEIVFPRCTVEPMISDTKKINGTEIGDHSQNLYGNMVGYWTAEGGTLQEKTPKFRQMQLMARKLTVLFKYSNEWKEDVPGSENKLATLAGNGLSWYRDKALLKGTGAGEPLGLLNADCTIEVAKEANQSADTIVYSNLANMVGRIHPACFSNATWIFHITAIPQLLQLSIPVGTGGSAVPVLTESNGVWRVLTRPAIFTEKTAKIGDRGDAILADLTQYVCGLRREFRFETSNGPGFTTDESYGRLIARLEGQPLWDESLTLEDGSTTVSPFVTLAAR